MKRNRNPEHVTRPLTGREVELVWDHQLALDRFGACPLRIVKCPIAQSVTLESEKWWEIVNNDAGKQKGKFVIDSIMQARATSKKRPKTRRNRADWKRLLKNV